jgi:hypothetical protein
MPAWALYQACGTAVLGLWSRRATRLRTCSRSWPACRAPFPAGGHGPAGWGATAEDLAHRLGDLDLALGATPPAGSAHREQRRQVVGPHGLQRARVQRRRQGTGRSAMMLYQWRGILLSSSRNLVGWDMRAPEVWMRIAGRTEGGGLQGWWRVHWRGAPGPS